MRLLIQSAMIFFGTLMVAGLLALGELHATAPPSATQGGDEHGLLLVLQGAWPESTTASPAR